MAMRIVRIGRRFSLDVNDESCSRFLRNASAQRDKYGVIACLIIRMRSAIASVVAETWNVSGNGGGPFVLAGGGSKKCEVEATGVGGDASDVSIRLAGIRAVFVSGGKGGGSCCLENCREEGGVFMAIGGNGGGSSASSAVDSADCAGETALNNFFA
jgi:hypothetical protein